MTPWKGLLTFVVGVALFAYGIASWWGPLPDGWDYLSDQKSRNQVAALLPPVFGIVVAVLGAMFVAAEASLDRVAELERENEALRGRIGAKGEE